MENSLSSPSFSLARILRASPGYLEIMHNIPETGANEQGKAGTRRYARYVHAAQI